MASRRPSNVGSRRPLIRADVYMASEEAREAIQIGIPRLDIRVVPGVYAGRETTQVEVAMVSIHEQRVGGDGAGSGESE